MEWTLDSGLLDTLSHLPLRNDRLSNENRPTRSTVGSQRARIGDQSMSTRIRGDEVTSNESSVTSPTGFLGASDGGARRGPTANPIGNRFVMIG